MYLVCGDDPSGVRGGSEVQELAEEAARHLHFPPETVTVMLRASAQGGGIGNVALNDATLCFLRLCKKIDLMCMFFYAPLASNHKPFIHRFDMLLFDKALMKCIISDHGTLIYGKPCTAEPLTCYVGVKPMSSIQACVREGFLFFPPFLFAYFCLSRNQIKPCHVTKVLSFSFIFLGGSFSSALLSQINSQFNSVLFI